VPHAGNANADIFSHILSLSEVALLLGLTAFVPKSYCSQNCRLASTICRLFTSDHHISSSVIISGNAAQRQTEQTKQTATHRRTQDEAASRGLTARAEFLLPSAVAVVRLIYRTEIPKSRLHFRPRCFSSLSFPNHVYNYSPIPFVIWLKI